MHRLVLRFATLGVLLPLVQAAAPIANKTIEEQVISQEKQSWRAWQQQDLQFWQRHLSADHIEIEGPAGPQDKDAVIKAIASRKCSVLQYDLGNFTVRELDPNSVLLVYRAAQQFGCQSGRVETVGWITSLYEFRSGHWENVLFEQQPAAPVSGAIIRPLDYPSERPGS